MGKSRSRTGILNPRVCGSCWSVLGEALDDEDNKYVDIVFCAWVSSGSSVLDVWSPMWLYLEAPYDALSCVPPHFS